MAKKAERKLPQLPSDTKGIVRLTGALGSRCRFCTFEKVCKVGDKPKGDIPMSPVVSCKSFVKKSEGEK